MITNTQKIRLLQRWLGKASIGNDENNVSFWCPLCKDNRKEKKKLVVRMDGTYHCWVCDVSGKSFHSLFRKVQPQALKDPIMSPLWGEKEKPKPVSDWDDIKAKIQSLVPKAYAPVQGGWQHDESVFED